MKVYVEVDNKFILLTEENYKDNFENEIIKEEIINKAMDRLEAEKIRMEMTRHKNNPVKMLKLGVHPDMRKKAG